jgi:hypothetical protein
LRRAGRGDADEGEHTFETLAGLVVELVREAAAC